KEFDQQIVSSAKSPVFVVPKLEDPKAFFPFIKKNCLERKAVTAHLDLPPISQPFITGDSRFG
ncbi:MAG TPA: hypothetical protein VF126_16915, partial [Acidobacteriaceae bacterium]